jgi:outer membrane protein assembly factor BamB
MGDGGLRKRLLVGLSGLLVLGVSVVVVRWVRSGDGCRADVGDLESVDDLSLDRRTDDGLGEPPESMGTGDQEAYDGAVQALTAPPGGSTLGDLEAFYPGTYDPEATSPWDVPTPIGLWGDTLVVATELGGLPGMPWEATLTALDADGDDSPRWVRSLDEFPGWLRYLDDRGLGGGQVGDRFVALVLLRDRAPEALSIDPVDGQLVWCRRIGPGGDAPSLPAIAGSQTPDGDLLVARFVTDDDGTAPGAMTVRLDADSGDVEWEVTDDQPLAVRKQDAVGSLVVQSLREEDGPAPEIAYRSDGEVRAYDEPVVARSVDDGTLLWAHPPVQRDDTATSQFVIGAVEERIVVAQATQVAEPDGSRSVDDVDIEGRIVALDPGGEVQWEIDVPFPTLRRSAATAFTLAGDLLVGPTGENRLGAWHLDDGSVAWDLDSDGMSQDRAHVVDDHLLHPGRGLTEIDLRTGTATPALGEGVQASRILVGDEHVAIRTNIGIAVFSRG